MLNTQRDQLKSLVSQEVERVDTQLTLLDDQERSYREDMLAETNERDKFRLRLKLETLAHTHAGMTNAKAGLLAFSAPVNRLPDEFLSHIFLIAARQSDWINLRDLSSARQFPLLIAQVCKRWRKVALATPPLWACLMFRTHRHHDFQTERLALNRSGTSLLYIDIEWDCDSDSKRAIAVVLDLLQPHFRRVRSFDVTVTYIATMQLIFKRFPSFSPALQRLVLYYRGAYQNDGRHSPMPFLTAGAPQLLHATFYAVNPPWDHFPFTNLEDLHLVRHPMRMRPSWMQFVGVLSKLPRLRTLEIDCSGPSFDPAPSTWSIEPTLLPVVRFRLRGVRQDVATGMLRRFILPNVQEVCLDVEADLMTINMLCQRKTFATAQKLATIDNQFCATSVTDSNIRESFGFPNVTSLTLHSNPAFIAALSNPVIPCFPKLDTLVTSHVAGGLMRSLVQGRMEFHGFPPLKSVQMFHAKETTEEDLDWLNEHVESLIFQLHVPMDPDMFFSENSSDASGGGDIGEDADL